jgi:hypothetical protein
MTKQRSDTEYVATSATKLLKSKSASKAEKQVAASVLSQLRGIEVMASKKISASASKILRDPKSSKDARSTAASALIQRPKFRAKSVKTSDVYRAVETYFSSKKA